MTEAVVDASVVLKWFQVEGESHGQSARLVRARFERGDLSIVVPRLLHLEVLNVAGRRWRWQRKALLELVVALEDLRLDVRDPSPGAVAQWTARGLTAYDACYVALAEAEGIPLITDDDRILGTAPKLAAALSAIT